VVWLHRSSGPKKAPLCVHIEQAGTAQQAMAKYHHLTCICGALLAFVLLLSQEAVNSSMGATTCPLLPAAMAAHLAMAPDASTPGTQGASSSSSSSSSSWEAVVPGVTPGDLAGDAWWRKVPPEWCRKASSRGQQDYLFTPAAEELQPGHERYTLATAMWWYRSLQGEPILVRGARVSG
jgi:hypothetical protein